MHSFVEQVSGLYTNWFVGTVVLPVPDNAAKMTVLCYLLAAMLHCQWFLTLNGGNEPNDETGFFFCRQL